MGSVIRNNLMDADKNRASNQMKKKLYLNLSESEIVPLNNYLKTKHVRSVKNEFHSWVEKQYFGQKQRQTEKSVKHYFQKKNVRHRRDEEESRTEISNPTPPVTAKIRGK